jgi:hypothetical protein
VVVVEVLMAKAAKVQRVPVTERAIVQRINRKLDGRCASKPGRPYKVVALKGAARGELGKWVLVRDLHVERDNVDLDAFGRELEVLKPWEEIAS